MASINKVDKTTGELVTLASGQRMWVGTQSAHDSAVSAGTMPNNCMVCITDDYDTAQDFIIQSYTASNLSLPSLNYGEFNTDISATKSGYVIAGMWTEHAGADAILCQTHFFHDVLRCTYFNAASVSQSGISITVKVLWKKNS